MFLLPYAVANTLYQTADESLILVNESFILVNVALSPINLRLTRSHLPSAIQQ
ncbi:hypothetical protein [Nostoc sp.]|uniref:hypothetical protein n=1 Tax=Nostoc sp. TaxID=1180 RepID=UPI002FF720A5